MAEHDDDLESEVGAGDVIETESFPSTAEELARAAEDAPEPDEQAEDVDEDPAEL